ncbi:prepilin-type N-terminal cleavage/methylation domain-containing protein [Candidatus Gracilibacteria bacterium 28_42_T64]|nr:prepilin-type N-terminal cleavage/methylation domain-containing protein [Candidatus Gracilibacteria bacterium 28_42_T64]
MRINKSAFTLVELIVVITILAILGTIAFISLQGYSRNARDSNRISDASSITTSLEVFVTTSGFYPEPEEGFDISYSGAMVWHQGLLSDNVITNLKSLNTVPVDPLTGAHYTYSRLNTKKEFELGLMLEVGGFAHTSVIGQATAASKVGEAYIKGTYNGIVAKVTLGPTLYMLAVPSIINGSIGAADYEDIVSDLVFNGGSNAPSSYDGTDYGTLSGTSDSIEFSPLSGVVIYSGSTTVTTGDITTVVTGLQDVYNNSGLENDGDVTPYLVGDASSDTDWTQYVGEIFIHENIDPSFEVLAGPATPAGGGGVNLYDIMFTYLSTNNLDIPFGFNNELIEFSDKLYFVAADGGPVGGIFNIENPFISSANAIGFGGPSMVLYSIDATGTATSFGIDIDTSLIVGDDFAIHNNRLYFAGKDDNLYYIDSGNTVTQVAGVWKPEYLKAYNNKLYFASKDSGSGDVDLYYIDGVSAPQKITIPGLATASEPKDLTIFNNELYFSSYTASSGKELLYINTGNSVNELDVHSGTGSSSPQYLTLYNGRLYFKGSDGGSNNLHYITTGHSVSAVGTAPERVWELTSYNNLLYFLADDGLSGNYTLRYINTSGALTELAPVGTGIWPTNFQASVYNNKFYFQVYTGTDYRLKTLDTSNTLSEVTRAGINNSMVVFDGNYLYNSKLYFVDGIGGSNKLYSIDNTNTVSIDTSFVITGDY